MSCCLTLTSMLVRVRNYGGPAGCGRRAMGVVSFPDHFSPHGKIVSCPDPLARAKRVWCFEQHFLPHGEGPILDLRSPSDCRRPHYNWRHKRSHFETNQKINNENVSCSVFLAVPIDFVAVPMYFAAVSSFCKPGYVVSPYGLRHQKLEFRI